MTDKKYNGWTNWETWNANLWLTNDEGSCEMAKACKTPEMLKEMVENWADEQGLLEKGLFTDLINMSLRQVNWVEVWEGLREA